MKDSNKVDKMKLDNILEENKEVVIFYLKTFLTPKLKQTEKRII